MKFRVLPLFAALLLAVFAPLVAAADEVEQFRLTPALLDRLDAIEAEGERLRQLRGGDEDEDEDEDDDEDADDIASVDAFVARIEGDPEARAILARHGVKPREFALAAMAILQAGTWLAFEGAMKKGDAERMLAGFTPAQRANIELLRQRLAAKEGK
ncbi:MAG: hypothetical protein DIU62_010905 [Pseudomonadota bacterium]|jgi:hypothetical protein|nr:MAG: hypothetical protein DIU62_15650 [Pseudomonadota bacterium]